jgi:hypothetical protein
MNHICPSCAAPINVDGVVTPTTSCPFCDATVSVPSNIVKANQELAETKRRQEERLRKEAQDAVRGERAHREKMLGMVLQTGKNIFKAIRSFVFPAIIVWSGYYFFFSKHAPENLQWLKSKFGMAKSNLELALFDFEEVGRIPFAELGRINQPASLGANEQKELVLAEQSGRIFRLNGTSRSLAASTASPRKLTTFLSNRALKLADILPFSLSNSTLDASLKDVGSAPTLHEFLTFISPKRIAYRLESLPKQSTDLSLAQANIQYSKAGTSATIDFPSTNRTIFNPALKIDDIAFFQGATRSYFYLLAGDKIYQLDENGKWIRNIERTKTGALSHATTLTTDGDGRVFVKDDNGIQIFNAEGEFLSRFAAAADVYDMTFGKKDQLFALSSREMLVYALK